MGVQNPNISGNAATATLANQATTLQFPRLIGGVSFNGSANINLPGVNAAGNQNTSGTAAFATAANFGSQLFTANGTFTIPAQNVKVTVVSGGGGGGSAVGDNTNNWVGGRGGPGAVAVKYLTGLTIGNTLTVTRGAGGVGGTATAPTSGGTSSVSSGTQTITAITATGGAAGQNVANPGITTGGNGAPGAISGHDYGKNGDPTTALFGVNGVTPVIPSGPGTEGTGHGTYGGGANNELSVVLNGGAGAPGFVLFEW